MSLSFRTLSRASLVVLTLVSACRSPDKDAESAKSSPAPAEGGDATGAPAPKQGGADQVIAAHIAAIASPEKLAAVQGFHTKSRLEVEALRLKGTGETWWTGARFYHVQELPGAGKMRMGSDGTTIWSDDPISQLRVLEGTEREQAAWLAAPIWQPAWRSYLRDLTVVGETKFKEKTVTHVKGKTPGELPVDLYFDVQTKLLVGETLVMVTPTGNLPHTVELADYREVDGVKLPHKVITENPLLVLVETFEAIELNPPVDDTRFALPIDLERVPADPKKQSPAVVTPKKK